MLPIKGCSAGLSQVAKFYQRSILLSVQMLDLIMRSRPLSAFGRNLMRIARRINLFRLSVLSISLMLISFSSLYSSSATEPPTIPPPIVNVVPQDGSFMVYVQPGEGAPLDGDVWFYQLRAAEECSNPYGNTSTWDSYDVGGLVPSFQIGKQEERYGVDLSIPLTNGCAYTINVSQVTISPFVVGEFTAVTAIAGVVRPLSQEEVAEIERVILQAAYVEAIQQKESRRQSALQSLTTPTTSSTSRVSLQTFINAGVESVIPQTLESLNNYLLKLDVTQRGNISLIETKARELRQDYFLQQLRNEISLINLLNLNLNGVSNRIVSTLREYLNSSDNLNKSDLSEIQRQIDTINILFEGRDSGTLSASKLSKLGVKFSLDLKQSEVLYKFRNQPEEVFGSVNTIQQAIDAIESTIRERLAHTSSAKSRTDQLRKKMELRKS